MKVPNHSCDYCKSGLR